MAAWIVKRKCKVHKETELVKEIMKMSKYCGNSKLIARVVGCHVSYVKLVLAMAKSKAHVFLPVESYNAITEMD